KMDGVANWPLAHLARPADLVRGRAGFYLGFPIRRFESRKIVVRYDPPTEHHDVFGVLFFKQLQHTPEKCVVRAGVDTQADRIHILLNRHADDLLRCLMETGIDHFHPGVTQRARNQFDAPVMPVEPYFADQNTEVRRRYCHAFTSWRKYLPS